MFTSQSKPSWGVFNQWYKCYSILRPLNSFFFLVDAVDASPPDDEELVYSQPEDGKPKPIPVNEFPSYYKQKSENGAIVLRDEFKVRYVMP